MLLVLACQCAASMQNAAAQSTPAAAPPTPVTAAASDQSTLPATLRPNTMAARVAACTACHGEQGRAGADGYYPRLAGKPQDYLYQQLLHFRDGDRIYRPMTHLLAPLPDAYLYEIAGYFAAQHAPYPPPARGPASSALLERGRLLTQQGDPARDVPACVACHGARLSGLAPAIPAGTFLSWTVLLLSPTLTAGELRHLIITGAVNAVLLLHQQRYGGITQSKGSGQT